MNNAQLRVRIDSLQASHTTDGTLMVSGEASFKYYDRGGFQVRPIPFQSYGEAAVALNNSGVGAIHVVSGRLNIFKPNDANPNHRMLLTVERTIVVGGQDASPSTPVNPVVPLSPLTSAVDSPPVPVPAVSNGKAIAQYDSIPF
jgi:hypothetical protein